MAAHHASAVTDVGTAFVVKRRRQDIAGMLARMSFAERIRAYEPRGNE